MKLKLKRLAAAVALCAASAVPVLAGNELVRFHAGSPDELARQCVADGLRLSVSDERATCENVALGTLETCTTGLVCISIEGLVDPVTTGGIRPAPSPDAVPFDSGHAHGLVVEGLAMQ
jgi:hypothetical protein